MGDPRKIRRKFNKPSHPWRAERIEEEHKLAKEYGLKKMREIWRGKTFLATVAYQAKRLIALHTPQAEVEKKQLLTRLSSLGLMPPTGTLTDVLSLTIRDVLNRRLQTVMVQRKLARSANQARQFINHEHVLVKDRIVSSPSYLVSRAEEDFVTFKPASSFANPDHPERAVKSESK
ncbi:30S ribosomal protein S4 [Candidatus Woesearchaeota archaeon]|nr:30S ribosomal protein S4 [Candidatus Woesearchaeota archaeon]